MQVGYDSRSSFYNAIDCKSDPRLTTLLKLATLLDVRSVEELFGDFGSDRVIRPKGRVWRRDGHWAEVVICRISP